MVKLRGCPQCRPSATFVRTRVDYTQIYRSFGHGQMVGKNIDNLARRHMLFAKEEAPKRTYRLANLHYQWIGQVKGIPPDGPRKIYYLGTKAGYAKFLLGTKGKGTGRIFPQEGGTYNGWLFLRPVPYSWFLATDRRRFQKSVSGQKTHEKIAWLQISLFRALISLNIPPDPAPMQRQILKLRGL